MTDNNSLHKCRMNVQMYWYILLNCSFARLFVKLPQPGDSELTFSFDL